MSDVKKELLELLEKDARLTKEQLSKMLNISQEEIEKIISEWEKECVILNYRTVINWDKLGADKVTALIEVNVSPEREYGFDKIAERIYRFPQVKSAFLMSGSYDLAVIVEGESMQDIANFVAKKLATLEPVTGTKTHFVMKRYKEDGLIFAEQKTDKRLVVSP